jgi:hypothetical protein
MTRTPPPESERPDGYKCLGLLEVYYGRAMWIECEWDADGHFWTTPLAGCSLDDLSKFAPHPSVAATRIEELEAEVERLRDGTNKQSVSQKFDFTVSFQTTLDRFEMLPKASKADYDRSREKRRRDAEIEGGTL